MISYVSIPELIHNRWEIFYDSLQHADQFGQLNLYNLCRIKKTYNNMNYMLFRRGLI